MRKHITSKSVRSRPGFTLLELLISMSLMIVLFSMIWSLIRIYSNYYVAGTRRIDQSQLVRSLSQLLSDDLGAAIQDPIHPLPPTQADEDVVRRFGLLGTTDSLRVDVIQVNPLTSGSDVSITRQAAAGPVSNVKMQVPELKTIYYDFLPLAATVLGKQSGLVRRELSFEDPGTTNHSLQGTPSAFGATTIAEQLLHENDPNAMWAPEIVEIRFRYSDGGNWLDSWDSIEKNGLPVAVEVVMKLMAVEDVEKLRQKAPLLPLATPRPNRTESPAGNNTVRAVGGPLRSGEMGQTNPSGTELEIIPVLAPAGMSIAEPPPQTLESLVEELGLVPATEQRLVVYLATSPLVRSEPIRRPVAPPMPRPPAPPVTTPVPAPAPPPPPPPQPPVPSQQWLRK